MVRALLWPFERGIGSFERGVVLLGPLEPEDSKWIPATRSVS